MELNELMLDRSQEPHWRETARWIKFEEDVEEETERWGKPHVASLSFRSLLELRRTIAQGRAPQSGLSHRTLCPPELSLCWAARFPGTTLGVLREQGRGFHLGGHNGPSSYLHSEPRLASIGPSFALLSCPPPSCP